MRQGFDPEHCETYIVIGVIAMFLVLALAFSLGPIFEGPDELQHYRFIRFVLANHDLPTPKKIAGFESHQPPVYYAIAAPIKALFDDSDFAALAKLRNPFQRGSDYQYLGNFNKNLYLHPPTEAFPYTASPTALTIHVLRLLSLVMGTATIVTGYGIFRELWPDRPDRRIMALAFMAFWPLGVYFAGLVNNDGPVNLLSTIALLLVLYQLRHGPSLGRSLLLGAVLGLAVLSKVNAVYLALPVGAAVLMDRRAWPHAVATLAVTILIAGWWFARNMLLYHEPSGITLFYLQVPSARVAPGTLTFTRWGQQMIYAYTIAWARFGPESIPVGWPLLQFFNVIVIVSLLGGIVAVVRFFRARSGADALRTRQWIVMSLFSVAWIIALGHVIAVDNIAAHGHLLLPGLAGYGAVFATGLDTWTPPSWRWRTALSALCALLAVTLICLFGYFRLSYQPMAVPTQIAHPVLYRFGTVAELIGTDQAEYRAQPGETIYITLYWRALKPASDSIHAYLNTEDSDLVQRSTLPGSGNLLASVWQSGETWAEKYPIIIPADTPAQRAYPLVAGLYDAEADAPLEITDRSGAATAVPSIGRLVVSGPKAVVQPDYRLGDAIGLKQPAITVEGDKLSVCFRWVSLKTVQLDYQVFIHVIDSIGKLVDQADVQPKSGLYPTSAWSPGEVIDDCVTLKTGPFSSSAWRVATGMYDLASGSRLPIIGPDGRPLPEDQVVLQALQP